MMDAFHGKRPGDLKTALEAFMDSHKAQGDLEGTDDGDGAVHEDDEEHGEDSDEDEGYIRL
jgi:hypothetical protein